MTKMENITIIVQIFNSGKLLENCLNLISNQKDINFSLIIANSTNNNFELLSKYNHKLLERDKETNSRWKLLKKAISLANTEKIVIMNSDVILSTEKSISHLIHPLQFNNRAATFGRMSQLNEDYGFTEYKRGFPESNVSLELLCSLFPLLSINKSKIKYLNHDEYKLNKTDNHYGDFVRYIRRTIAIYTYDSLFKQIILKGKSDFYIYPNTVPSIFKILKKKYASSLKVFRFNREYANSSKDNLRGISLEDISFKYLFKELYFTFIYTIIYKCGFYIESYKNRKS